MKKKAIASVIGLAALVATVQSSFGQGQVFFANYTSDGVNAPITYAGVNVPPGKAGLTIGNGFTADLLYSLNGGSTWNLVVGSATAFSPVEDGDTGSGAGYFIGSAVTIPDYTTGAIQFIVRAFSGATWEATQSNPQGIAGTSDVFTLAHIATGLEQVGPLTGLQSFSVAIVPEPSIMALAGLSSAALLIFRRRK